MFAGGALDQERDNEQRSGQRQNRCSKPVLHNLDWCSFGPDVFKESSLREDVESVIREGFDLSRDSEIMTFVLNRCSVSAVADAGTISDFERPIDGEFLNCWPRNLGFLKGVPQTEPTIGNFNFWPQVEKPHGNGRESGQSQYAPFERTLNANNGADRDDGEYYPNGNSKNSTERWSENFCRTHIFILTARSYLDARDALIRAAVCGRK